jgi:dihydroxy-acid dehydratase
MYIAEEWRKLRRTWLYKAMGFTDYDIERPIVAIVNTWSELNPGHYHLRQLAEAAKRGVWQAGGTPLEFNTISICDGFILDQRHTLPIRDLMAFSTEMMLRSHGFDGAIFLSTCDKNVPAQLIAAARVNLPSIFITGGAMLPGKFKGENMVCCADGRKIIGEYDAGRLTEEELSYFGDITHSSIGACGMMGTANTMQCLVEVLGLSLPGCGSTHAVDPKKYRIAEESGRKIVELSARGIHVSDIVTKKSLENAIRALMALGGSTNGVIHLLALAKELNIPIELSEFDRFSRNTPFLTDVKPSGKYTLWEFDKAGGVPALLKEIKELLYIDVLTVTGKTLGENLQKAVNRDEEIIRPLAKPIFPEGGIAVLKGSLAPKGAIVKQTAVNRETLRHEGPAKVFESMDDVEKALLNGEANISPNDVLVIRGQGPKGGPGMTEQLIPPILYAKGLEGIAIVTDARTSGSTRGLMAVHVAPEAAVGGPIAIVQDGDIIRFDIPSRRLDILIHEDEIQRRLASWQPRPIDVPPRGWMRKYSELVGCSSEGALIE